MASSLALYLKVKGSDTESNDPQVAPQFTQVNENTIEFSTKQYRFKKIINGTSSAEAFQFLSTKTADPTEREKLSKPSSECCIFLGPTGSGKTTTMNQVLQNTLAAFPSDDKISMTAFEVIDNKIITDLLDENLKKEYNITFESQLRRIQSPQPHHLQEVFTHRSSFKTSANPHSSRSCLVVTFHQESSVNGQRWTFIDMMGNEKYDKHTSNIFANLSMSSITELLVKKSNGFGGRSSNLVTNLIFKKDEQNHIKLILHLDPRGDASLTKSSLNNIALLVHKFKMEMQRTPSIKSKSIALSALVPSYARPTISSSTTTPKTIRKVRSARRLNQPISSVPTTTRAPSLKILSAPAKSVVLEKPVNLKLSPVKASTLNSSPIPLTKGKLKPITARIASSPIRPRIVPDTKFKSMREKLMEKTIENETLRKEHLSMVELLEKTRQQISEYSELAEIERKREASERERLLDAKREIMEQVEAFKNEFYVFKDTHESFNGTIESLKVKLSTIEEENRNLKMETEKLKSEFLMKEETFMSSNNALKNEVELLNLSLLNEKSKLSQVEDENMKLNSNLDDLKSSKSEMEKKQTQNIADLEEKLSFLTTQKDALESDLRTQLDTKETKLNELSNELASETAKYESLHSQISDKDQFATDLQQKFEVEQQKCHVLTGDISELKNDLNATLTELSAAHGKILDMAAELDARNAQTASGQDRLAETEELLTFAKSEIDTLQNTVKSLEISSFETRKALDKARDSALAKDDELAATREKMIEYENELSGNRGELQRLRETHGEANNELLTTMVELDMAEKALESKQIELNSVISEKSMLKSDYEQLQLKNSTMKSELAELKAQQVSSDVVEENMKLKADIDQLKAELKTTSKELTEMRNASDSLTLVESDADDMFSVKTAKDQQHELEKLRSEVAEIEHLKDVLESKESQIARMQAVMDENTGDMKHKVESLQKERSTLVQENEELLNSLTSMKTKYYTASQELKTMKKDAMLLQLGNNELLKLSASPESSVLATSSPNSPIDAVHHDDISTAPILLDAPLKKPFDAKQIFRDKTSKSPSKSPSKSKKDKHALTPSNRNLMEISSKKDKKLKRKHSDFKLSSNKIPRAV